MTAKRVTALNLYKSPATQRQQRKIMGRTRDNRLATTFRNTSVPSPIFVLYTFYINFPTNW